MRKLVKSANLSRKYPIFHCNDNTTSINILLKELQEYALYRNTSLESCMQSLFSIIEPSGQSSQESSPLFDASLSYIHEHYNQQISINDIAKAYNIDRTYLYKLFMQHIQMSPQEYLLKYRIEKACEQLRFTKLSLTDIAYSVGFQDYSGFSKQFKKYSKISPRNYRKLRDTESIF